MSPRNAVAFEVFNKEDLKKPGAYQFMCEYSMELGRNTDRKVGIRHGCPCGCGGYSAMWFAGGSLNGTGADPTHEWQVVGEWPKVTLSPSIGIGKDRTTGKYHWHGFLRAGVFVEE